jgi:phenylacetate-CoA ligase
MASKLEQLYAVLPVPLQNVAVSLQGWRFARERYGKIYQKYLDELMRSQWLSHEEFREMQTNQLRSLLKEAVDNVPYYQRALSNISKKIDSISLDSIGEIPILEKFVLRTQTREFTNEQRLKYGYSRVQTSGTSGSPLSIPQDSYSIKHNVAFRSRQFRWAGITGEEINVLLTARLILGNENRPPFWRRNAAERQWLFSLYHISDENLASYVDKIAAIQPVFISGLVSGLYVLARWIRDNGRIGDIRPWAIITAGETVHNFQREEIERAFNSRIFDYYSSSEGAPFITQCPAGRMHINPESGIIEFLRPDGTNAQPGEDAEMVVTSFYQRTVPLIRYRIGDTAAFAENQSCPCGRQMPIVEYVGGRESDTLCSSERGRVGSAAISTVFYKLPSRLKESQIEQVGTDSFVFRYVPQDAPLSEQEKSTIIEEIKNRLGSSIDVDVQIVEEIPKGPNTKSRLIVGLKENRNRQR